MLNYKKKLSAYFIKALSHLFLTICLDLLKHYRQLEKKWYTA